MNSNKHYAYTFQSSKAPKLSGAYGTTVVLVHNRHNLFGDGVWGAISMEGLLRAPSLFQSARIKRWVEVVARPSPPPKYSADVASEVEIASSDCDVYHPRV